MIAFPAMPTPAKDWAETFADAVLAARCLKQSHGDLFRRSDLVRLVREHCSPKKVPRARRATPVPSEAAKAIYAAYPRHIAPRAALEAISVAMKGIPADDLLAKVKAYREAVRKWPARERAFIPHPATWFNRGSWADDPKEWQRSPGPYGNEASAAPQQAIPEPTGWREWARENMTEPKNADRAWASFDRTEQKYIAGMVEKVTA